MTTFLQRLLGSAATDYSDERFWTRITEPPSATGLIVTPETALRISTVWACTELISACVGMLPTIVYERLADGGRQRATSHPLYDLLHDQPNRWQTAFEFKSMLTGHMLLRGNGYAKIEPGPRGFADQLVPLHPDKIKPEPLADGGLRYLVTELDGSQNYYNDDQILHLRGMSMDGKIGLSVVSYARESLGLALAGERSGARTFGNGSRPSGVLKTPGKLSPEAAKRVKASWDEAQAGVNNTGKTAVLEEGLEWQAISQNNKDTQWLESREFQAEDICRWFRVPPHMVGLTSKSTSWGSGLEQMSMGFVTYTLMPWFTRWSEGIARDLIIATQKYFVEFLVDALLKGDLKARYDAYAIARTNGWLNVDEIRQRENMNPLPNGQGQKYLQPLNMTEVGAEPTIAPSNNDSNAHYYQLVREAASRIVRKETAALGKLSGKFTVASDEWMTAVKEFYATHADFVSQTLRIDPVAAQGYVNTQLGYLATGISLPNFEWESDCIQALMGLVLHP